MEITEFDVSAKEQSGVWFSHGDAAFLVCSVNKPAYERLMQAKLKPHRRAIRRGMLSDETADKIAIEAAAEHILIDWRGLKNEGEDVPYSKAKAIELMTRSTKFLKLITDWANDAAAFQESEDSEGVQNLKNV